MSYAQSKNILATVTYYDVLDFPLTAFEIWKHLVCADREQDSCGAPSTLTDIVKALFSEQFAGKISERDGFYFLPGREALVEARIQAEKLSVKKLKGMRRLARRLAWIPYLRMLGATGSLAMKHGKPGSDWDMFIVLKSGRIWSGRTFLTGFLHLIGKRRHGAKIADRACLNYFLTDKQLEIGTKDLYSAHEYRFLIPLLGLPVFRRFELQNAWIQGFKPNFLPTDLPSRFLLPESQRQAALQGLLESLIDRLSLEGWLGRWQKEKIAKNPNTRLEGSHIEASDRALIFLPRPRGPRVFQLFKERLRA